MLAVVAGGAVHEYEMQPRQSTRASPPLSLSLSLARSLARSCLDINARGPAVCSAAAVYTNIPSHGTYPGSGRRGCWKRTAARAERTRSVSRRGPAGSPILIHSITADNDRLNGPASLDELRRASASRARRHLI